MKLRKKCKEERRNWEKKEKPWLLVECMSDAEDCVVKSLEGASGRRGIAGWTRERSERIQPFEINWSRGFLWTRKSAAAVAKKKKKKKKKKKEKRGVKKWNLCSSSSFSPYATLETKNPNISTAFGCWIHRLKFPNPAAVRPSQNIKLKEDGMKLKSRNLYIFPISSFPSFLSEPWCCYNPIAFSYSTADGNPGGDNPFLLWLRNDFLFLFFVQCSSLGNALLVILMRWWSDAPLKPIQPRWFSAGKTQLTCHLTRALCRNIQWLKLVHVPLDF